MTRHEKNLDLVRKKYVIIYSLKLYIALCTVLHMATDVKKVG